MKLNDAILGAVFLVLGLAVLWYVQSFPGTHGQRVGPALFPGIIAAGMVVCALILIVQGVRKRAGGAWVEVPGWWRSRPHVRAFIVAAAMPAFYVLCAQRLGFFIVGFVSLLALMLAMRVRPRLALVTSLITTAAIWFAFYKLLRVPLPWGLLQSWAF